MSHIAPRISRIKPQDSTGKENRNPKNGPNLSDAGDPLRLGSLRAPAILRSNALVSCQLASASARICSPRVRPQPPPLGPAPAPYANRHMRPTQEQLANTALAVIRFRCVHTRDDASTVDSHLRCTCSPEDFEVAAPSPTTLPFMSQYVDCSPPSSTESSYPLIPPLCRRQWPN